MARAFDPEADFKVLQRILETTVKQMNARGERFDHPMSPLSGLWGNTLYKYQQSGDWKDAPFGALFMRLYNSNGKYKNIKECYGQAEIVIRNVRGRLSSLTGTWEVGMASQPGHYWACLRADLGKQPGADPQSPKGKNFIFLHLDPWKNSSWVTSGAASSVSWNRR